MGRDLENPLHYDTYEEAVKNYLPTEKWSVFDGSAGKFNITHECIDRNVDRGIAIRVRSGDVTESYTFKEVSCLSSKFANLISRENVCQGERVFIMLEPCLEFYTSFFGSLKAGAAVVVGSSLMSSEGLKYRLEDSKAKLVVTSMDLKDKVDSPYMDHAIIKDDLLDMLNQQNDEFEYSTSVNDIAVVQYTSGTTGHPKPILYRHKSLVSLAPASRFAYGIKGDDSFFCPSPLAWGHGVWAGTCAPLMFGAPTSTCSGRFDPERMLEVLEELKVNNLSMAPTGYRKVLSVKDFGKYNLRIEKMTYAGEPMDLETFHQAKSKFGADPCSVYGSTEVGVIIANFAGFKDWIVKPGSVGKPMLGLEVAIIDEHDNPLPPNVVGEIAVKSGGKWVRVGDSGMMDEDLYFWHRGRTDDVIKSSGYRIGAQEVEIVLNGHEAVLESAVIGIPDRVKGQIVKAFVVLRPGYEPSKKSKDAILLFGREKLSKYAYPREMEFIGELPKGVDGKIRRKDLRLKESRRRTEMGGQS